MAECIFCLRENLEVVAENNLALAFFDACPVSRGHTLIIPKRHVETYFDASEEEHTAINNLVKEVRTILDQKFSPDGYNIGANTGSAAGQTVFHFHIHLIPRFRGDVEDPRGGVRKVIPTRSSHQQCSKQDLH